MTEDDGELKELRRRLSRDAAMRAGLAVLAAALGGFAAWASLVPLTEGVVASGAVAVDTAHKTVQHLEGGIVAALHVREGSEVKAGELLIALDDTRIRARLDLLESRYHGRLAELDRLRAERRADETIAFSEELLSRRAALAETLATQEDLFEVRRRRHRGEIEILRHRIDQLRQKTRGLEASLAAHRRGQALLGRDLKKLRGLYRRKLVEEGALLAREREYEQGAGEIGRLEAEIAQVRVAVGEARQEILQSEHALRSDVADRITVVQQEWFETREQLAAARDVLRRKHILAPQDGKVIGLTAHTVGGVIPPGSPIMNIVPSADRLVIEARVRPTDIDNVRPGQTARLRFPAFSLRSTPELSGRVDRISPDAFRDEETRQSWYAVRILVSEEELAKLGGESIGPGMPVDAMLTGGERTALEYLSDPLVDLVGKALVEE